MPSRKRARALRNLALPVTACNGERDEGGVVKVLPQARIKMSTFAGPAVHMKFERIRRRAATEKVATRERQITLPRQAHDAFVGSGWCAFEFDCLVLLQPDHHPPYYHFIAYTRTLHICFTN